MLHSTSIIIMSQEYSFVWGFMKDILLMKNAEAEQRPLLLDKSKCHVPDDTREIYLINEFQETM